MGVSLEFVVAAVQRSSNFSMPYTLTTRSITSTIVPSGQHLHNPGLYAPGRFERLCPEQVTFVTGVDEHGQKIERTAERQQLSLKITATASQPLPRPGGSDFDDRFVRTTNPRHLELVEQFYERAGHRVTSLLASRRAGTASIARNTKTIR